MCGTQGILLKHPTNHKLAAHPPLLFVSIVFTMADVEDNEDAKTSLFGGIPVFSQKATQEQPTLPLYSKAIDLSI